MNEALYSEKVSFFFLVEGGRVYIRDWRDRKSSRTDTKRKPVAPGALKTRPCWFHDHHPQRCPLQAEHCAFAHGPDDLRPSSRPLKKTKKDTSCWRCNWFIELVFKLSHCFVNQQWPLYSQSVNNVTLHHLCELNMICLMLPEASSGFTVDLADTSGFYCLLNSNFKGLFWFFLFISLLWSSNGFKLYFKIRPCIFLEIIQLILD